MSGVSEFEYSLKPWPTPGLFKFRYMDARELRIGNYVNFNNRLQEGQEPVIKSCDFAVIEKQPDWVEPIPLTEEWLVKLGFSYNPSFNNFIIDADGFDNSIKFFEGHEWVYSFDESSNGCYHIAWIEYVHQLQNLFFALTGKDLQFKNK